MTLSKHVFTDGDPWPFKDMEVGDVVICTHTQKQPNAFAHAYGAGVGKVFTTRRTVNKATGEVGYRIERLPDNTPKYRNRAQPRPKPAKARRKSARVWPFESLGVGEHWRCKTPADVPAAISAAHGLNRTATAQWRREQIAAGVDPALVRMQRKQLYTTDARVDATTRQYVSVTITRLAGDIVAAKGVRQADVGIEKRFGPAPVKTAASAPESLSEILANLQAMARK